MLVSVFIPFVTVNDPHCYYIFKINRIINLMHKEERYYIEQAVLNLLLYVDVGWCSISATAYKFQYFSFNRR